MKQRWLLRWLSRWRCRLCILQVFLTVVAYLAPAAAQEAQIPLLAMAHGERINGAYLSPDESHLVTTSLGDPTLKLWDMASGTLIAERSVGRFIDRLIWLKDSRLFVIYSHATAGCPTCTDGFIHVFTASGALQATVRSELPFSAIVFSPDETELLLAGGNGDLSIFDMRGERLQTLPYKRFSIPAIHWYTDNLIFLEYFNTSNRAIAAVWDTRQKAEIWQLPIEALEKGADWQTSITHLKSIITTHDEYPVVWILDDTDSLIEIVTGHPKLSRSSPYRPGDRYLSLDENPAFASDRSPSKVHVWNTTGQSVSQITHAKYILTTRWNSDQSQLLIVATGAISVWAPQSKRLYTLALGNAPRGAVWSPDSKFIAGWNYDTQVYTFTAKAGQRYRLYSMQGIPAAVTFSKDGTRILARTGNSPNIVSPRITDRDEARVWLLDRTLLGVYTHDSTLLGASWMINDTRVLTWSADGVVKVWAVGVQR